MVQIRRQQTRITSGRLSHLNDFINGSNQDVWSFWRGEGVSRVWSVVHWHEAGRTEDSLPSWLSPLTSQSCPLLYFYFTFLRRRTPPTSELDKRKNVTQQTNPANSVPGPALHSLLCSSIKYYVGCMLFAETKIIAPVPESSSISIRNYKTNCSRYMPQLYLLFTFRPRTSLPDK